MWCKDTKKEANHNQQAVLLIAGHWYNQREDVSAVQMAEVPYPLQALVNTDRKLV